MCSLLTNMYSYWQMCDAVSRNDFERAKQLVDDDERRFRPFRTFLMRACDERKKAIVDILLNSGVAVDKTDLLGRTALMHAAEAGYEDIFELLLKHNADVMKKDWNGCTVFHMAAECNYKKNILDRLLLLMVDEHCNSTSSNPRRTASLVWTVDIEDDWGRTPLWYAASNGHMDYVDELLIHGANPDHKNKWGESPLDIAKQEGHTAVVNKLSESIRSHFSSCAIDTVCKLKHSMKTLKQEMRQEITVIEEQKANVEHDLQEKDCVIQSLRERIGKLELSSRTDSSVQTEFVVGEGIDYKTAADIITDSVLKFGASQWISIGIKLGYNYSEVEGITSGKTGDSSKLQAIVAHKQLELGNRGLIPALLAACRTIPHNIHGAVVEHANELLKQRQQETSVCHDM